MRSLNKYIIFLFMVFAAQKGHGQMLAGLKISGNICSINYRERFDQSSLKMTSKTGYAGGLVFQYFSEKYLGLQAELIYTQKGFKTRYDTITDTQYERSIGYLSLPVMSHFYFVNGKVSPFLLLGAFGSLALTSEETFRDGSVSETRDYDYQNKRDNKFEYGVMGGGGFKGNFSFGTIQIEATYSISFNSLFRWGYQHNDPALDAYFKVPEEAQNTVLQVSLTYLLPLNKNSQEN